MTPRPRARALASAASVAAKDWLVEPAEPAEPCGPAEAPARGRPRGRGEPRDRGGPADLRAPRDAAEPRALADPRQLRAVPASPRPAAGIWLPPAAGGPAVVAPAAEPRLGDRPPHAVQALRDPPLRPPPPQPPAAPILREPLLPLPEPLLPLPEPLLPLPETPLAATATTTTTTGTTTGATGTATHATASAAPVPSPQPATAASVHSPPPPAAAAPPAPLAEPALPLAGRGVVAVIGLGRRCGATVVARALACELARRDGAGASAVTVDVAPGGMALGLPAAGRLARMLAPAGVGRLRPCGRLCLVETVDRPALAGATLYLAPLVLDDCDPRTAPVAAAIADHLVIVGGRGVEPALATALAASLAPHAVGRPLVVANRVSDPDDPWTQRADLLLPDSRLGAQLALAGQDPRGALGRAVSDLVDRLDAVASE